MLFRAFALMLPLGLLATPAEAASCQGRKDVHIPAGMYLYCTKHIQVTGGLCNETDQVQKLTMSSSKTWKILPFDDQETYIVGITLVVFNTGPVVWAAVGNNYMPNVMVELGANQLSAENNFQAGYVMPWPSAKDATDDDYLDLHFACKGGGPVNAFVTIRYIVTAR